jgi:Spy/CpxP family protein refolding chaperone
MKFKTITIVMLVGLLALWVPNVMAQGGGKGGGGSKGGGITGMPRGRWWNNTEITKQINLNDAQSKKIQAIMVEHQKEVMDLKNEASKLELDLDLIMEASSFNADKAESLLEKIQEYRAKSMLARGKMLIQFRKVLSQDQYIKLKSLRTRGGRGQGGKGGLGRCPNSGGQSGQSKPGGRPGGRQNARRQPQQQ